MIAALLWGCAPADDTGGTGLVCESGPPTLELTPVGQVYRSDAKDVEIPYGWPPQGGAPYAPFLLRVAGVVVEDRVTVTVRVADTETRAEIGSGSAPMGLVCANVGDDAGWFVGSELHALFWDSDLEGLDGRAVSVTVEAEVPGVGPVSGTVEGALVPM